MSGASRCFPLRKYTSKIPKHQFYSLAVENLVQLSRQKRKDWIAALDKIESLSPRAVIAGHKRPASDDNPRIIEETRQYIRDFERLAEKTTTRRELYDQMLQLHPDRLNPIVLWTSALAFKGRVGQ